MRNLSNPILFSIPVIAAKVPIIRKVDAAAMTGVNDALKSEKRATGRVYVEGLTRNTLTPISSNEMAKVMTEAATKGGLFRDIDPKRPHPAPLLRRGRTTRRPDQMIKWQMYGRASLDLLRKRVLLA